MRNQIQHLIDELEISLAAEDRDGFVRIGEKSARELVSCALADGARSPLVTDLLLHLPIEYPSSLSAIPVARLTLDEANALLRHARRSLTREEIRLARVAESEARRLKIAEKEDTRSSAAPKRKRRKKGSGRPTSTDRSSDQRLYQAWQTGNHPTYADLAREMNLSEQEVKWACDRARKQLEKAKNARKR